MYLTFSNLNSIHWLIKKKKKKKPFYVTKEKIYKYAC
jgi:hypothetical protein